MNLTRRDFIATSTLAALSVPLIGGCARNLQSNTASDIITPTLVNDQNGYFERNFGITREIIDKVLTKAMSRGGSFGDLFFEHTRTGMLTINDGMITEATVETLLGAGVRCMNGIHSGYAYTQSLTLEDLLRAAEAASFAAPGDAPVPIIPRHDIDLKRYYSQTLDFGTFDTARAIEILKKIDSQVRAKTHAEVQIFALIVMQQRNIMVNTSDGINAEDKQPLNTIGLSITMSRNGVTQSHEDMINIRTELSTITQDTIDKLIDKVYTQTELKLQAIKPKAGEWPIILEAGDSGILLHEAVGHGLEADHILNKTSIYSDMMNKRVAPEEVTVGDTGIVPNSHGAYNMDDEGTPCQDTILIEYGVLRSYMHDRVTAQSYDVTPTGNGRRQNFSNAPMPRMRTTYMKNGTHEKDELLEGIEYGIFCSSISAGEVSPGQGDYTFYVQLGYLIEHGKLTAPVSDFNIIGNGPDTLSKITMVANDFQLKQTNGLCQKNGQLVHTTFGMPSVRVSSIIVGGI